MLVARDFHGRTGSAFDFLIDNGLPVKVIRVSVCEDQERPRFVDVEGEHEPSFTVDGSPEAAEASVDHTKVDGRRIRIADLLDSGLLQPQQTLVRDRPRLNQRYHAKVLENGSIQLQDGRTCSSPARAAMEAAGIPSYDGWYAWRLEDANGATLQDLRTQLVQEQPARGGDEA